MNICGKKVLLRAMEPKDMECMGDMLNNPDVANMVVGWSFPVSEREQSAWHKKVGSPSKDVQNMA